MKTLVSVLGGSRSDARGEQIVTVFFISRHRGAVEWAERQGLQIDRRVVHLDSVEVSPGDTVVGTLPVHLVADICARGARYLHLALDLPEHARGRELTADELDRFGARLDPFLVQHELCASGCVKFIDAAANGQDRK